MQPRILLVEDQLLMQQVELGLLAKAGYSAEVVDSGEKALRQATQQTYDIIFMDVCLTDMEGTEVTKRLREQGINIPVIAITGNDDEVTKHNCRLAGMNGFLAKPMDSEQFRAAIEAFVK